MTKDVTSDSRIKQKVTRRRRICLFVSNVHGGSGPILGKNLQLPFDRNGDWPIALSFVASLVLKLCRDREYLSIFPKRGGELGAGVYFQILADAEYPVKNWYTFVDHRQIERLWAAGKLLV